MQNGTATKPVLGVTGSVSQAAAPRRAAAARRSASVQAGSPAQQAGLAAGDVVTKVGDAKVEDFADLIARIGSYAPGAQVTLTVQSGGAAQDRAGHAGQPARQGRHHRHRRREPEPVRRQGCPSAAATNADPFAAG